LDVRWAGRLSLSAGLSTSRPLHRPERKPEAGRHHLRVNRARSSPPISSALLLSQGTRSLAELHGFGAQRSAVSFAIRPLRRQRPCSRAGRSAALGRRGEAMPDSARSLSRSRQPPVVSGPLPLATTSRTARLPSWSVRRSRSADLRAQSRIWRRQCIGSRSQRA
jgi:hypothetical protein